jgi:hypothetical protein
MGEAVISVETLLEHQGHDTEVVTYGDPEPRVALECVFCGAVLVSIAVDDLPKREVVYAGAEG